MQWCEKCGARSPPEMDEVLTEYYGEYFCSDECRNLKREEEDAYYK